MAKLRKILRFLLSYRQLKGKDVNINCFQGKNLQNTAFFAQLQTTAGMRLRNKTCLFCFFLLKSNCFGSIAFFVRVRLRNKTCLFLSFAHQTLTFQLNAPIYCAIAFFLFLLLTTNN